MQYICLPQDISARRLPFYLAMEEYLAREKRTECDAFFMWQVEPTVIFGRNQDVENEVNLEYCKSHCINFFRRKSGGGCVYADMSNVMLSYITAEDNVEETFKRYLQMISETLESIGMWAFACCERLEKAELPKGLKSIGEEAFSGCHKLSVPELPAGLVSKGARIFTEVSTYY